MFAPKSPDTVGKNKRKRSGSARPDSIPGLAVRHSPPLGHRNAQALSQPQSMTFLPPSSLQSSFLEHSNRPVPRHSLVDTIANDSGPPLVVSDLGKAKKTRLSQDTSKDAPNTTEANQQGDKRQVVTTWDAVNSAYGCVPAAFATCPDDTTFSFLAGLPAAEGALAANDKKGPFRIPDYRLGRLGNLKAALVQAHGLRAETPCGKCAAGKSLWTTCMRAPTLPAGEQDIFSGACASCFYGGKKQKCDLIQEVTSQQSRAPSASAATPADVPPEDGHKRQQSNSIQEDLTFYLAPEGDAMQKDYSQRMSAGAPPKGSSNQHRSYSAQIASTPNITQDMSANQQNAEELKFKLQDLTMKMARRARMLPLDERPAVLDRVQSLLAMGSLEPEGLELARCVFGMPDEEKFGATRMILEILRSLLG